MLAAFFTVLAALFPSRVARVAAAASAMPARATVVGLVNWVFFVAVVLALLAVAEWTQIRFLAVPAIAIAAVILVAAVLRPGWCRRVARQPAARADRRATPHPAWALWCWPGPAPVPYAGWFALLPYVLVLGLGSVILSLSVVSRPSSR